jgi:hypothetical protein
VLHYGQRIAVGMGASDERFLDEAVIMKVPDDALFIRMSLQLAGFPTERPITSKLLSHRGSVCVQGSLVSVIPQ